jgi:hypothetical protein
MSHRMTAAAARRSTAAVIHEGYKASVRARKRIEEVFGWMKTAAGHRKTRFRGTPRVGMAFTFAAAAYNLIRMPKLLAAVEA